MSSLLLRGREGQGFPADDSLPMIHHLSVLQFVIFVFNTGKDERCNITSKYLERQ